MSIYAIGDLQGCHDTLQSLLVEINFKPKKDTLWFTGDLVNRGGQSLETLEFLYSIRDSIVSVLGNHDLHLIAAFYGNKILPKDSDLLAILESKKSDKLIKWLCSMPLLHHQHKHTLVHAGIAPSWSLTQAQRYANEVENALRSSDKHAFLENMYGDKPNHWSEDLTGHKRLRCITNHLTRMRYVEESGDLELSANMHPKDAPKHLTPWFRYPQRKMEKQTIIFGHWASLVGQSKSKNAIALDTGCVWGGKLTAYNIKTQQYFSI